MEEIWKDVPGYEGLYQVSNMGRVKSLERRVPNRVGSRIVKERVLKTFTPDDGYPKVTLSNVNQVSVKVNRLVAMAFLEHKPCGFNKVVTHKNHDTSDCRLENLVILTLSDNNG